MLIDIACLIGLAVGLLVIVVEDLRAFRIPDRASLPLIAGGILCAAIHGGSRAAIIGAAVGYLVMASIEGLYRAARKRDGLGRGDAKLFAAAGAWVGWTGLPHVLLVAAGTGLAVALATKRFNAPIPFAPFLALGILCVLAARRAGLV